MELVAHITMSAPLIASSGWPTGTTSTPSDARIAAAKASRLRGLGLKQRIVSMSRTAQAAISCAPACQPEPRMPTRLGVLAGEIFDAEPIGGADPHALHHAVGQDRERLAALHREQQHQSDIAIVGRGRHLFAPHIVAALGPGDDVGIDAHGADAELRGHAVHGFEAVERIRPRGRCEAIGPRARDAASFGQLGIGLFHHLDAVAHRQQLLDVVVGEDQGHDGRRWLPNSAFRGVMVR